VPPTAPDDHAIAVHLDKLLADRGMTLTELSERVGVSLVNLSILKNGRARAIRFSTLTRLCQALDCQPGDLLSYHDPGTQDGQTKAPPNREAPDGLPGIVHLDFPKIKIIPNGCWFLWRTTITFQGLGSAGLGEPPRPQPRSKRHPSKVADAPRRPHAVCRCGITTPWP
jgi:putative transcriptional regulator